jgi:fatty acid desaturase
MWSNAVVETAAVAPTVKTLARVSGVRALGDVALTWGVLVAAVACYVIRPTPWTFVIALVIIASRQYALLILMHDGFHGLIHPNRLVNDFIGAIVIGAPCGSAYWQAKAMHLKHHRRLGEGDDPELFLHSAGPPRDKRSLTRFLTHFALLISGGQVVYTHLGASANTDTLARRLVAALPRILRVAAAQLCLLTAFTMLGSWTMYFTLWLLPLTTLAVVFNGVRAFCDHACFRDDDADPRRLVTYVSNPVERFFLAPFHMNFHAEHHLFPYVPHYRLPELRRIVSGSPALRGLVDWRHGYLGFVADFLRAQRRLAS